MQLFLNFLKNAKYFEANSQHYSIQSTISLNQSPRKAQKRRTTDFDEDFAKNNIEDEFTWFGQYLARFRISLILQ